MKKIKINTLGINVETPELDAKHGINFHINDDLIFHVRFEGEGLRIQKISDIGESAITAKMSVSNEFTVF